MHHRTKEFLEDLYVIVFAGVGVLLIVTLLQVAGVL